ncbi:MULTISPECIES: polysaccharide deacetylase family protein [unclassified Methylobacterium]|uniref:polysaccharide deacetylase family protein n=1 Tax=unclassified Methylobacterium TaxID=2615210 RepID=UPI00226AC4E5|nr:MULTISPECIES: polysaccharide deacetylase family protein [unclassified Methylobacterium]
MNATSSSAGVPWRHRLYGAAFTALAATGARRWLGPIARGDGVILTFHHVRPWREKAFAPNRYLEITPEFLGSTVRTLLEEGFEVIPLDDVPARLSHARSRRPFAVLTFDDGYRDNLYHARPVLRDLGVPWTLFVTESLASGTGRLWWVELEAAVARLDRVAHDGPHGRFEMRTRTVGEKYAAFRRLSGLFARGAHADLLEGVAALSASADVDGARIARLLCADWSELTFLAADPSVTIGSHTLSHPVLSRVTAKAADAEIGDSKSAIAARIGRPVRHLAYPSGGAADAGEREFGLARGHGYATAVTTRPGHVDRRHGSALTALPRISVNGHHQDVGRIRQLASGVPFLPAAMMSLARHGPASGWRRS